MEIEETAEHRPVVEAAPVADQNLARGEDRAVREGPFVAELDEDDARQILERRRVAAGAAEVGQILLSVRSC